MRFRQDLLFMMAILLTSIAHGGAWGTGSFENDDALDWIYELEASNGLGAIEAAVRPIGLTKGYIDASLGSYALAAAESLAALKGNALANLPEEVSSWVDAQDIEPSEKLLAEARSSLEAILDVERSELAELWSENSELYQEWRASVNSLAERLK